MISAVFDRGTLLSSGVVCEVQQKKYQDIPTLVWSDGIDEDASDWFRDLIVSVGVRQSTAYEYAKTLRPFLRFCRQVKTDWTAVDDSFLVRWRSDLVDHQKVSVPRINSALKVIFSFYVWAERTGRIRYRVGIYELNDLPQELRNIAFPISAKRTQSRSSHGRVYQDWTTPLTLSDPHGGKRSRHTPGETEIRNVHEAALSLRQGVRDTLILSWAEETGARRVEILRVLKPQIPSLAQLSKLIEADEPCVLLVERKGGAKSRIVAPCDLIVRTIDYIDMERREVVERCKHSIIGYVEPTEVFLSSRTGQVLHPDSVTSIGGRAFRRAGVKRANIHRLRARFAVRLVDTLVEALLEDKSIGPESVWVETILTRAAEMMGHASPQSLRPYLNYVLNRRIQTSGAIQAKTLEDRVRSLRLSETAMMKRISHLPLLQQVADHLRLGRHAEGAEMLKAILRDLEQLE